MTSSVFSGKGYSAILVGAFASTVRDFRYFCVFAAREFFRYIPPRQSTFSVAAAAKIIRLEINQTRMAISCLPGKFVNPLSHSNSMAKNSKITMKTKEFQNGE